MKKFYTLLIALFLIGGASGQTDDPCGSCFPEGILFETQAQIDSFQYNYPFCTEIIGDVNIGYDYSNNYNITNLNGLSQITSILGNLEIQNNQSLTSLSGLENICFIGGEIIIDDNDNLTNLTGLEGLSLINELSISNNDYLSDLTGLHNIDTIVGRLSIRSSHSLVNLSGLNNLTICGSLRISNNDDLTNLTGLENISAGSITGLWIHGNSLLSTCDLSWLCNYLDNPNGSINIFNNAQGCDSPQQIADICGITLSCLPYGNYYFTSQLDLDEFSSIYPDCVELEGNVHIWDYGDITDLSGLSQVTSIAGGLILLNTESLSSLDGLDSLTSIGGIMIVYGNDSLINFMGLDNVTSIAGGMMIWGNPSLTSMTGLENLTSTGALSIIDNSALLSLTGLDNIDADSINGLEIMYNYSLSQCEVKSICDYLSAPGGSVEIEENATGCYTQWQVLDSCEANAVDIAEPFITDMLSIYPNPSSTTIVIKQPTQPSKNTILTISNTNGQQLITQPIIEHQTEIDISHLPAGIYLVKVWNGKDVMVKKVIKQ